MDTRFNIYFWGSITVALTLLSLTACSNLEHKGIMFEQKVIGLDISIPSTYATQSFMSCKFGYIATKYGSVPNGKVEIDNHYNDISIWELSGTATSNMSVENYADTTRE